MIHLRDVQKSYSRGEQAVLACAVDRLDIEEVDTDLGHTGNIGGVTPRDSVDVPSLVNQLLRNSLTHDAGDTDN